MQCSLEAAIKPHAAYGIHMDVPAPATFCDALDKLQWAAICSPDLDSIASEQRLFNVQADAEAAGLNKDVARLQRLGDVMRGLALQLNGTF